MKPRLGVAAIVCSSTIAGCGLGAGHGASSVTLTVTRAFGTAEVAAIAKASVPGSETVMRVLQRSFRVTTRYGGGFVESIDGLSGSSSHLDWFYYVNGIEAPQGAATTAVHRGDRIWWDLHDWSATNSVPAVVGSFPEPFIHGMGGRRLPTVLECGPTVAAACRRASAALAASGVAVATQLLGASGGSDVVTLVVAPWSALRGTIVARLIQAGPQASGVYARFGAGGGSLDLLDPKGRVVQTLGAGAGLLAATDQSSAGPTWVITGTDEAGVQAAAGALSQSRLHDRFALAVQGQADFPLPLRGAS
jgi:hypothetical protein